MDDAVYGERLPQNNNLYFSIPLFLLCESKIADTAGKMDNWVICGSRY